MDTPELTAEAEFLPVHLGGKKDITGLPDVFLREMCPTDVYAVTYLHTEAFPNFFLSFLGRRFLRQFYLGMIEDPFGIAIIADHHGSTCGFVVGSAKPSGTYRRLLTSRFFGLAWSLVPALMQNPMILARLIYRVATRISTRLTTATAELMSIAVHPDVQGRSIGRLLMTGFIASARNRGVCKINLDTDADLNARVNAFYQQQGFNQARSFRTLEGRQMIEYELKISPVISNRE